MGTRTPSAAESGLSATGLGVLAEPPGRLSDRGEVATGFTITQEGCGGEQQPGWGWAVWPPSGPAVVCGAVRLAEHGCRDSCFNFPAAVVLLSYMLPGPMANKLYLFHALATVGK